MLTIRQNRFSELKGFAIIRSEKDLNSFIGKLPDSAATKAKLKKLKLSHALEQWLLHAAADADAFFAFEHELPDHRNSDGYGCYKLFRFMAVQDADKKVHLLRAYIELFYY